MAVYTTTIKTLKENNFDFGLKDYPIFDENYRDILNNKILNHYYFNEIGQETANVFKFLLNQTMDEIMPFYNILYQEQVNNINNLTKNVNLNESFLRNTSSESSSSSSSVNDGKNLFQDTPQGKIFQSDIDDVDYATNATLNRNDITDNSSVNGTGNENYIKSIIGNNGNMYGFEVISKLNKEFINIDMEIINKLSNLFMGLF